MQNKLILITGVPRSGTSLVAGIISICGAWGGEVYGSNDYNKRGMYENKVLREDFNKQFLKTACADPMGQNPLPDRERVINLARELSSAWEDSVLNEIRKQGYKEGIWFFKDAKNCLIWPIWHTSFPLAKWIIVRRKAGDIADSCMRTPFMSKIKTKEEWLKWVKFHEDKFEEMKRFRLDVTEIWTQSIIDGDYTVIKKFIKNIDLTWDESKINDFVSRDLWHS